MTRVKTVPNKTSVKENSKMVTPLPSKKMTQVHSTTRINRHIQREDSCIGINMSSKSQSALKASQAEFRERAKKKQEKEQEALKKREALLLALTEERKKKREEKQLKAQQQREMMEKEKLKLMAAQKLKVEEKLQQQTAERDEKVQQYLAKKRAEEKRQRERLPVYMTTPAPLLPTEDCYDSDEEEAERGHRTVPPSWTKDKELKKMQHIMLSVDDTLKNTFFCRQTHTPDLQELFETIDPRKLRRNSSAVWKKPPRYTVFMESSSFQFSEDDED